MFAVHGYLILFWTFYIFPSEYAHASEFMVPLICGCEWFVVFYFSVHKTNTHNTDQQNG